MKAKHMWWTGTAVVAAAVVAGTAALGVDIQRTYDNLTHGEAYAAPTPGTPVAPVTELGGVDQAALAARLDELAGDKALANFGGQVIDTATGQVVWERNSGTPLTPASSTKVLTLAAASYELGHEDTLTTEVVRGQAEGNVVIKAAGDVWLTNERLDALAEQIKKSVPQVNGVYVDTSAWSGGDQAPGWDPENVDGGYVAPMQPVMLYGGRLGDTTGDVPRSHEPALDVARALASRLGTDQVGPGTAAEGAEVLASSETEPLSVRAQEAAKDSDNVMAEAIGREIAVMRGKEASFAGAAEATLEILAEHGIDLTGVTIKDNSGLSTENRIPARVLTAIMDQAAEDEALRPLLGYLPIAGGDGTLVERYMDNPARGYVRAKTGTLTGVSALTGTAQGNSGHVYAFGFLVNDGEVTSARKAQDALASALHEF